MYCFDTDILAAALLREPPLQLVRRLAQTPGDKQCTTAISVAEIAYAVARNGDHELAGRVRDLIAAASRVFPFDHDAADVYGPLRARLEGTGVRLDEPSLRIAAIALSRDLTLVTASARLYDRVPDLEIENWLEPDEIELLASEEAGLGLELGLEPPPAEKEVGPEPQDERPADDVAMRFPGLVGSLDARAREATSGTTPDEDVDEV